MRAARDHHIRTGDIIISRRNGTTVDVRPGPHHHRDEHISQVRNGNRWRVAGLDAATVHSAQGVTADTAHAVIGETASRAIAYVAMSRGRERNDVYM